MINWTAIGKPARVGEHATRDQSADWLAELIVQENEKRRDLSALTGLRADL